MVPDLFKLKRTKFLLWRPLNTNPAPRLVVGVFQPGNPPSLRSQRVHDLKEIPGCAGLWGIDAADCGLIDGQVCHYWFEVTDSHPARDGQRILCTDPTSFTVDWRLLAERLPHPYTGDDRDPASVVKFAGGLLVGCDAAGEELAPVALMDPADSAANNRLVIYELPTSWSRTNLHGDPQVGVGTFRDVTALIDQWSVPANFAGITALDEGRSHLALLGVNALELLPPADSFVEREWGYATSNYFAPDFHLGFPSANTSPTPNIDLANLVNQCHEHGIRFFADVVMAFGTRAALENVNFHEFHIDPNAEPGDPDVQQSGGQGVRDGFGGMLWRYSRTVNGYDPLDGQTHSLVPARQLMKAFLLRWMADFGIDGLRVDSVNNIANWDFVGEFKDLARSQWRGSPDRFLVVGEELSVPQELLRQHRLDGLWNEDFKRMVRHAVLGTNSDKEQTFEWTVRKLIDCRLMGFEDGAQAVNYLGSHDVEGYRNERLYNFLQNNGVMLTEERIKLAFVCLLTAVGVPMIFAGDEFADEHDLSTGHPAKQIDAVNFERVEEPWRQRVFNYVARLVQLRTHSDALAENDTDFIHVDFSDGKRVLVWRRGRPGTGKDVVIVANFSDFISENLGAGGEYRIPNWPPTPAGKRWREITQQRDVPTDWVGREAIAAWEAKVYCLVDE
ncbi:1,4-alpha-glucan branching enzyme [Pseudarthrobacter oxydans]|uniref:alpha-amylase family glycosyl hydrolase n=1 Tax=Pseudarthrobacter oxydans TaxID=1671 RepID=UPI0027814463|nr:alpha-amylase family glycosyl hydrolase [Pseudarthrobacter oxydans]MDP9984843.1 1,4-alpha-glucan branching enzyme [Pseudarthrobacter oxydans]